MARGSITRRGDSWTGFVDIAPDPRTGKRRQKRVTARTKREVEALIAAHLAHRRGAVLDSRNLTLAAFLESWTESAAQSLRPATLRRYRDLIRLHIVGSIGTVKLITLSPVHLQA